MKSRVHNSCKKLGVDYKQICTYNPGDISSLWGGPVTYPSLDYIDYVGCNFDDNAKVEHIVIGMMKKEMELFLFIHSLKNQNA